MKLPKHVTALSMNIGQSCVLSKGGDVACWSHFAVDMEESAVTEKVDGLAQIVQISMKGTAACVLDRDGSTWCWASPEEGPILLPTIQAGMAKQD